MSDNNENAKLSESAEKIKGYLERVNNGEDFDKVQSDFAEEFQDVPVMDIMNAEQALIRTGIEPQKMKKLCDIHSALFHGQTEDEVISEEQRLKKFKISDFDFGHPVTYFVHENSALEKQICISEDNTSAYRICVSWHHIRHSDDDEWISGVASDTYGTCHIYGLNGISFDRHSSVFV